MTALACSRCGTGKYVAKVGIMPWCFDCYFKAHPEVRPAKPDAARSAWRARAEKGLPAFAEEDSAPTVQTMGLLFRMRRR